MGFWTIVDVVLKKSDIVLMVVDARNPDMSNNRVLEDLLIKRRKRTVLVFNKIDLISREALDKLKKDHEDAFFISAINNIGIKKFKTSLLIIAKRLGLDKPRIGVVGYPNVGKSALINVLAKRAKAPIAAYAGTTRGIQKIRTGTLEILDTPGVVPLGDNEVKLGFIGAKNPEKLRNPDKVAWEILGFIVKKNKKALESFYGISSDGEVYEILLEIGKKRGFLLKGGVIDERRTAIQIILDWQRGKLRI